MPAQTKEMWPGIKLITLSNVGIRLTKARKTPSDKVSIIMKSISNTDNSIVYSFPGKVRFFYGFGSIADGGINIIFGVYLLFYFTQVRGLSGTLAGLAIFIALLVDAITDPIMGSISDNFNPAGADAILLSMHLSFRLELASIYYLIHLRD